MHTLVIDTSTSNMILDAYCYFINDVLRTHLVCILSQLMECSDDSGHIFGKKYPFTIFQELDIILLPYLLGYMAYCAKLQAVHPRSQTADNSRFTTSFIPVLVTVLLLLARGTHLSVTLYSCMSFCLSRFPSYTSYQCTKEAKLWIIT